MIDIKSVVHSCIPHRSRKQKMSGANNEDIKEQELTDNTVNDQVDGDSSVDDLNKALDKNDENPMPSPQQEVLWKFFFFIFGFVL